MSWFDKVPGSWTDKTSELALADLFAEFHSHSTSDRAFYDRPRKCWYVWNDCEAKWQYDSKSKVFQWARQFCREIASYAPSSIEARRIASAHMVSTIVKLAQENLDGPTSQR